MRLDLAFPEALGRLYAVVKPDFPLITVLYLLRLQDLAAVPLTSDNPNECRAVFGSSALEKLLKVGPRRFASFLMGPCERASELLGCLTADEDLAEMLDSFEARHHGFAAVRRSGPHGRSSLLTLDDVLGLYETGLIKSDLLVEDVASPIFSMPASTSIRDALQTMLDRGHRLVFVSKDGYYVSDRSMIEYILNPRALVDFTAKLKRNPLDAPISKLPKTTPVPAGHGTSLREAALKLRLDRGGCLIMRGSEVVTPWDLVMKPWLAGKLVIEDVVVPRVRRSSKNL